MGFTTSLKNIATVLLIFAGGRALAGDQVPQPIDKHILPSAIRLQITPRGQKYFETNLTRVLGNLGVSLDEGYFPATKWEAKKDYTEDDLSLPPEKAQMIKTIKSLLTNWLVGFSLSPTRPSVEIGDSEYKADFSRFALVFDEPLLKSLGKTDGAILAIEMVIKDLRIKSNRIRVFDLNNQWIGKIGADDLEINIGDKDIPLKIRMPFYVKINPTGELHFEALEVQNNISDVTLDIKRSKLIFPSIAIEINGHRFEMNEDTLNKSLDSQLPDVLMKLRKYLSTFISKDVPSLLNAKAKQFMQGSLEEVHPMEPPGAEAGTTPLMWGLQLGKINLKESLQIDLNVFVEDPLAPHRALDPRIISPGAPSLNRYDKERYDVLFSLDFAMINRILQHSFERKLFSNISFGEGGGKLQLTELPRVSFAPPPDPNRPAGETYCLLHLKTFAPEGSLKDFDTWFLNKKFEIWLDIVAKIRIRPDNKGAEIVLHSVVPESIRVDEKYLTWLGSMVAGKVAKSVRNVVMEMSHDWSAKEVAIPGTLPIPPQILGMKFEVVKLITDPQGHLLVYMQYPKLPSGGM